MTGEARCPHHADDPREIWRLNCPACWEGELRRVVRLAAFDVTPRWPGDPVEMTARYLTDDRDFEGDRRLELVISMGGNGDWYVATVPEGMHPMQAVRLCTSGGASSDAPGLTVAISDAWLAIVSAKG